MIMHMERLQQLRQEMQRLGVDAFLVPSADEYLSEYVPDSSRRLEWLTGFTGSAGSAVIGREKAAFFTDGRYTLQARGEVDTAIYEIHNSADLSPTDWILEHIAGRLIGYDPRLHAVNRLAALETLLEEAGKEAAPLMPNPIDALWKDRPAAPSSHPQIHELRFAGESAEAKRSRICKKLREEGIQALLLTAPDSICWLLNMRGRDVPHTPFVLCWAVLEPHSDIAEGRLTLFLDEFRASAELRAHLGANVMLVNTTQAEEWLTQFAAQRPAVMLDPSTTPAWYAQILEKGDAELLYEADPCQLPKACKNAAEIAGTIEAHRRDGAALTQFLAWLDKEAPSGNLTEMSAAAKLREFRAKNNDFIDTSFETIPGFAANGAIVHYRATPATDQKIGPRGLFLVDSGGQYLDGTTDVTRTIAIGEPNEEEKRRFTQVLKGHISLARAVFPKGTTGTHLDALARYALWQDGVDYDHGTGHGVGSFLSVHEGPQRISKVASDVPLVPGMILSNEPGFYKEGAFGIRIENLVRVVEKPELSKNGRIFYGFESLTLAPIDRRLIDVQMLTSDEREWLNAYHARVLQEIGTQLPEEAKLWAERVVTLL